MRITINLDEDLAEALELTAMEINMRFKDSWTIETMAASLLEHVLLDDAETHSLQ